MPADHAPGGGPGGRPTATVRPEQFVGILGTTFITRGHDAVLVLGKQRWDRYALAALGVPQIKAARFLHHICQRLSITTPAQLAARLLELPAFKGVGHAAFYAALAILTSEGYDQRALAVYADGATSKRHYNPNTKDWEPTPVMLATLKRRTRSTPQRTTKRKRVA